MRRLFAAIVAAAIGLTLAPAAQAAPKLIAIVNFGEHPALRACIDGFRSELAKLGFKEDAEVVFSEYQVNFDRTLIPQMLTQAQAKRPDLIFSVTTGVTQASIRQITDKSIPIVFGSVVDPVVASIVPSWERGSDTHTGATMLPNFEAALGFVRKLLPEAKRLGVPYNPGEDNDTTNMELIHQAAPKAGFELVTVAVDNANDLPQRLQSLAGRVDAVFLIQSNVLQTSLPAIAAITNRLNLPTVNSVSTPVLEHQMLAAYAIDYGKNGEHAARIAARILNGAKPSEIPPYKPVDADFATLISQQRMDALGMKLPPALAGCDCIVK